MKSCSIPNLFSRTLATAAIAFCLAATAGATTILIDFGADGTTTPTTGGQSWNNVTSTIGTSAGSGLSDLVATTGTATGISLTIVSRFNGTNGSGTTSTSAPYPTSATRDSLFGNTEIFSGNSNIFPSFRLAGLVAGQTYEFTFFASRTGAPDNRQTLYRITGETTGTTTLDASQNVSNTASHSAVADASGEILIEIGPGSENNNANHFTYLNVLEINTVPEPTSIALLSLGGLFLLRRRR